MGNPCAKILCRSWMGGAIVASLLTTPVSAVDVTKDNKDKNEHTIAAFSDPRFDVHPSLETVEQGSEKALGLFDFQNFFNRYSDRWEIRVDTRNDRPNMIQGSGVPLIAGRGNDLAEAGFGAVADRVIGLEKINNRLDQFLVDHPQLLRVEGMEFQLDLERSHSFGDKDYYWNVELQQVHAGVLVEDAFVFFRINHGNIVQFGAHRVADIGIDTTPAVAQMASFERLHRALRLARGSMERKADLGGLRIYPVMNEQESVGQPFAGVRGLGYGHLLVWEHFYDVNGRLYKAVVDAESGDLLTNIDLTVHGTDTEKMATVSGKIFPNNNANPLVSVNLPFTKVSTSQGTVITDENGKYEYPGGTATARLDGRYIRINDQCGSIALSDSTDGNLDFGGVSGTDCASPPSQGGNGNTNAARSGFYHLTNINRKAASFLPGNSWLQSTLQANMNINATCNAFWSPSFGTVNFYRSGNGCSNTGEIAAIFLHEWGHGMDDNSGGPANDRASGEAVGDTFAFLETGDACIGKNFRPGQPCHNCNNSCTGVRDLDAFSLGGSRTIARPSTVTSNNGIDCDRFGCPFNSYRGIMGYQGHCESLISSTANWDLSRSLVAEHGAEGWDVMNSIWYGSLTPSGSAFRVSSGGQCNTDAKVDGCGQDNWYTVFLSVDDDDGNIANGTPNACRIWDAYNAHGIACGKRPQCFSLPTNEPPVADFSFDCSDLSCTFDGSSSTDDSGIVSYGWSFGDGGSGSGIQVSHTYGVEGTYNVTLTVSDGEGETDSKTKSVTAEDPPPPPLCSLSSFNVQSFSSGLPRVSWSTTCPNPGPVSVQVKTTTLSSLPAECRLNGALWDGNKNGSRTADFMAGGYGPSANCPAVEQARFWVELWQGSQMIEQSALRTANYNPPALPCDLTSFSVTNRSPGLLPIVSWTTTCPNPGPVSVQVRTTTISQQPSGCELDNALWDGNKNGSRTVDFMAGGYGNNCPAVGESSFWVELWQGTQLIRRSDFRSALYTPGAD